MPKKKHFRAPQKKLNISTFKLFPPLGNKDYAQICTKSSESRSQHWCHSDKAMSIDCGPGKIIRMSCAFYGVDQTHQCPGGFYSGAPTVCYAKTTRTNLTNLCNGRRSCSVANTQWSSFFKTNSFYCYGITK